MTRNMKNKNLFNVDQCKNGKVVNLFDQFADAKPRSSEFRAIWAYKDKIG